MRNEATLLDTIIKDGRTDYDEIQDPGPYSSSQWNDAWHRRITAWKQSLSVQLRPSLSILQRFI